MNRRQFIQGTAAASLISLSAWPVAARDEDAKLSELLMQFRIEVAALLPPIPLGS
jgi:hypothetical protein